MMKTAIEEDVVVGESSEQVVDWSGVE